MKIGIMTFHASLNCGSMLQAYALQEVLKRKYQADVEIINYSNRGQRQYYSLWDSKCRVYILKKNIKSLPYWKEMKKTRADYAEFAKKHFNLSGPLMKEYKELEGIDSRYDIVIAGGDQVWNIMCRDADKAYFLAFVKNAKKIAYSPSLGAMSLKKYAKNPQEYAKYIKDFSKLSVREPNGQRWIKEITGLDVPLIADPTMLLTADEWSQYVRFEDVKERYIFYYAFSYNDENNNKIIQSISKKYGLPVYMIDSKSWGVSKLNRFGIRLYKKSGPEAFLSLMKNAELVITQSFHGTVFSTLFHKKFWLVRNKVIKNKDDDRAKSILHQLGLDDRYVVYDRLLERDALEKVDYEKVEEKIELLRKKAYEYISEFMN